MRLKTLAGPALAVLLAGTHLPAQAGTEDGPLTVQELADREEIRTLLNNYARYLDDRRLKEYANLFAENGEWVGGFGVRKGPEEILAAMTTAFADFPSPPENRNYHVLSNVIIDTHGNRGSAWSRWTFFVKSPDNTPTVMVAGRYEDDLIRENGEWKFLRRVVISEIPYSDPREAAAE